MGYDIEKEKREAIEAGQRALSSLRIAKENLNSAKNWGLVDMFGGGFFSTMLKHSKIHVKLFSQDASTGFIYNLFPGFFIVFKQKIIDSS